jgi:exonuclease III
VRTSESFRSSGPGLSKLAIRHQEFRIRDRWPNERIFSYWDYRAGMFHRDLGMRIDLILAAAP